MTGFLRNIWVQRVLGAILGGIFIYAAWSKLLDPRPLVTIIWGYHLVPAGPANLMAIYMPWLEVLAGLGLLVGFKRRAAAFWVTALLGMFEVALIISALRGINVACGCFSTSSADVHNAWFLVARDVPMLLAALILSCFPPRSADKTA